MAFYSETQYQNSFSNCTTTRLSYDNWCNKNHTYSIYKHASGIETFAHKSKLQCLETLKSRDRKLRLTLFVQTKTKLFSQ